MIEPPDPDLAVDEFRRLHYGDLRTVRQKHAFNQEVKRRSNDGAAEPQGETRQEYDDWGEA